MPPLAGKLGVNRSRAVPTTATAPTVTVPPTIASVDAYQADGSASVVFNVGMTSMPVVSPPVDDDDGMSPPVDDLSLIHI